LTDEISTDDLPSGLKLWRYMSLPQLMALLTSKTLWFNRLDRFDDPTEGSWARGTLAAWTRHNPHMGAAQFQQVTDTSRQLRRQMYASCWHENDDESLDMWRLYCLKDQGVAVETTYGQLEAAIDSGNDQIFSGRMQYVDFRTAANVANVLAPAFCKQDGFASEKEARLLIWRRGADIAPAGSEPPGISVTANPADYVNTIWVGPLQPPWFRSMLTAVVPPLLPAAPIMMSRFDLSI
jgi:hypothetical protein